MKKYMYLVFLICMFFGFSYGKPQIATTVKPLADIVKAVGKDRVNVKYIIPPNVSVHFYEYRISDIKAVHNADLFLYIGSGEPNIKGLLDNVKGKAIKVSEIKGLHIIREFEFKGKLEEDHHHQYEDHNIHPALWLHPENSIKIAEFVYKELIELDPKNKEFYKQNLKIFVSDVKEVYREGLEKIKNLKNRYFISYHYTWPYFIEAFKLEYVDVIELGHGREPTPKHLLEVIEKIKKLKIRSVFAAKQFYNKKYGDLIKKQTSTNIIFLDPFGENKDYIQMLKFNIEKVYKNLNY
ncbi:metal ABC transporter substrate-binding protein [Persephonella sp.]